MYSLFYAYAFDDMKFELLKFINFDFFENEKNFSSEVKNISPRHTGA